MESIYESPQIEFFNLLPEGVLCQSSLESLDENQGIWG